MHGTEHRVMERRALRLLAPRNPVYPDSASSLPGAPQPFCFSPKRNRSLVTAFPSPAKAFAYANSVPGSQVLACYFAHLLAGLSYPFGSSAPPPVAGLPQRPAASTPQARCILYRPALPVVLPASATLWEFSFPLDQTLRLASQPFGSSSGIARFSFAPRSLSIERFGHGSSFPIRYASGDLLFPRML